MSATPVVPSSTAAGHPGRRTGGAGCYGGVVALVALLLVGLLAGPAAAAPPGGGFRSSPSPPPPATRARQSEVVVPQASPGRASQTTPASTCNVYASASGFGMVCSSSGTGLTLAAQAAAAGIDLSQPFCWDDPDLPDGFDPAGQGPPPEGPGRWWLRTCLFFEGAVVRDNARVTYEYRFVRDGLEQTLTGAQQAFVTRVLGRGQIPFLQVRASPVSSPRVDQDVAFSMLCSAKVRCDERPDGWHVETPRVDVGGVVMHAELVHLRVRPLGRGSSEVVDCDFAGLAVTAAQLDAAPLDDPRICRYAYERSSNDAGAGLRGDRHPATVTASWRVFIDDGTGPRPFAAAYEKSSTQLVRVTEVQTLVVS